MRERINPTIRTCTGCTACVHMCPMDIITIVEDGMGFQRAEVDISNCIDCGVCLDVCHFQNGHKQENRECPFFFAAYSKSADNVINSSSGGIFWELCYNIIVEKKGVVFGAVQESVLKVCHKRAETLEDVIPMRKSKYIESELDSIYIQVKEDLNRGRTVLFTGVGCQIAGLYEFLRVSYDNLYTCEVVCHGIPSYEAYKKYIEELEGQYAPDKVKAVNFRNKDKGWNTNSIKIEFESGRSISTESKDHPIHRLYLNGINMRPACANCSTASLPRVADITLADFWKYNGELMKKSNNKGLSLVALNNSSGDSLFYSIINRIESECVTEREVLKSCRHMYTKPKENVGQALFLDLIKKYDFESVSEIFLHFGDIVPSNKLHKVNQIDKDEIWDIFWEDARQIVYIVSKEKHLKGIISLDDYIKNFSNEEKYNVDYKYATFSGSIEDEIKRYHRCWEEIDKIFEKYAAINRVPVLDDNGVLCYEIRRKNTGRGELPVIDDKELQFFQNYERLINKRDLVLIKNHKELQRCDFGNVRFLVQTPGRAKLLRLICNQSVISIEEYKNEIRNIIPFLRLSLQGTKVLFVNRPDYISHYKYGEAAEVRIKEGYSFVKLSEEIEKNEIILKSLLKEKYSKEYVKELRKIPQIVQQGKRYRHIDHQSKFINVINGCRKTVGQPRNYDVTLHIYGRCGVFGYAVEDKETVASFLQQRYNDDSNRSIRVVNHGLWGADDKKIISNINEDVLEQVIKKEDIVVLYMNFIEGMEMLKKISVLVYDSTEDFHKEKNLSNIFYDRPGHMTKEGYRVISDIIYKKIEELIINYKGNSLSLEKQKKILENSLGYENEVTYEQNITDFEQSINSYLTRVKQQLGEGFNDKGLVGAIIMNCNPFTKGHRYLIEMAKKEVDELIIFVLEEDKSYFSFEDRYRLVKEGTEDLENVHVLPSGSFILSALTFPEYFIKEQIQNLQINPLKDIDIFAKKIAPELNIKIRFAGTEPQDNITGQYNETMREFLPKYGIEFREIPRVLFQDTVISASTVRRLLENKRYDELRNYVPNTTFKYLVNRRGKLD